jgi:putative SOS response-associated peptidase YedK
VCGRYTLAAPEDEILEAFDVPMLTFEYRPRYNIAPGQPAPVVAEDRKGRRIGLLEWGFLPAWKDEPGRSFINARSESVATTKSFREAFRRRRCLIPADGFYEWKAEGGRKIPYWIHPLEGVVVSFAGIWETWRGPHGEPSGPRHTFAVLTTDANAEASTIHDRMPVVIAPEGRDLWLDRDAPLDAVTELLRPAPDGSFDVRRVSTRVNRPDDDDAELIEPVES